MSAIRSPCRQGEVALDLAVYPGSSGLNESQKDQGRQLPARLQIAKLRSLADQGAVGRRQRDGGACAPMTRCAKRCAAPASILAAVALEPYFANGDPSAPVAAVLSAIRRRPARLPGLVGEYRPRSAEHALAQYGLRHAAQSRGHGRQPRGPHPPARRDAASWRAPRCDCGANTSKGDVTGSKWAPRNQPLSEHATTSDADAAEEHSDRRRRIFAYAPMPRASWPYDRRLSRRASALRACHIPRVNIQAFCEDQDTAAVIEKAATGSAPGQGPRHRANGRRASGSRLLQECRRRPT